MSGLDGMARRLEPGPCADAPYEAATPALPRTLDEALAALAQDACLKAGLGADFVAYYLRLKAAELARFHQTVTDWEQREYFEIF